MHNYNEWAFKCFVSMQPCWKWVVKDAITLVPIQVQILNRLTALVHVPYLGFSLLQRNGQLTMGNKASLSAHNMFREHLCGSQQQLLLRKR